MKSAIVEGRSRSFSGAGTVGSGVLAALLVGLSGCVSIPRNAGMPLEFETAERPAVAKEFPNWSSSPDLMESLLPEKLREANFELVDAKRTAQGTSGARTVSLNFPESTGRLPRISFKWKEMPRGTLDAHNDSPRRQIAAYELQKLFLAPEDYVVPTAMAHCAPLLVSGENVTVRMRPTLPGSACTLGLVQVWLENVTSSDSLYEEARFVSDPVYAYYLANFNLFTYLSDFADPKKSNFLVSTEPDRRQVFCFDNDIAFEESFRMPFVDRWNVIFVPALRRDSIERLRRVRREDLDRLAIVAQFERDESGVYLSTPPGQNLSPNDGVRIAGKTVQIGLARFEIEAVWRRIQRLLARVDEGEIPLF